MLDGPRLAPRSGVAKQLVVFLHGYGADGNDLIDIGRNWQNLFPDAAFVSPNAPEPCGMSPGGRQWFALAVRSEDERWRGVNHAQPGLDAFLDAELSRHHLDDSRLALVGFSQGTMMALHVGLRRKIAPAAIIGFSGMLVLKSGGGPEELAAAVTAKPPILLIHGDRDEVIPVDALFMATETLAASGIACQWHVSQGLGHGIDGVGLKQAAAFLSAEFKTRGPGA
jgi:phospholipase/carboxylesterase